MVPQVGLARKRAQGAFEYVLLIAGTLLVVVTVVVLLRAGVLSLANQSLQAGLNPFQRLVAISPPSINFSSWNDVVLSCTQQGGTYSCSAPSFEIQGNVVVPAGVLVSFDSDFFTVANGSSITGEGNVSITTRYFSLDGVIGAKGTVTVDVKQ